jgi:hypothetical protein
MSGAYHYRIKNTGVDREMRGKNALGANAGADRAPVKGAPTASFIDDWFGAELLARSPIGSAV